MRIDRRRLLAGLGATTVVLGAGRLVANEHRIATMRARGRASGSAKWPRQDGLTSTSMIWKVDTEEPMVALTFDDGPDPRYTPGVLEALAAHDASATFFMQGNHVEAHPDLARQVSERHAVGNHSYSHPRLSNATAEKARRELEQAHEAIVAVTGVVPRLFRPPYGHLSGATSLQAAQLGYDIVLWSQTIRSRESPQSNLDRLHDRVTPGDILLGHDGGNLPNQTVVDCLPGVLTILADQGYRLVTVAELLESSEPTSELVAADT